MHSVGLRRCPAFANDKYGHENTLVVSINWVGTCLVIARDKTMMSHQVSNLPLQRQWQIKHWMPQELQKQVDLWNRQSVWIHCPWYFWIEIGVVCLFIQDAVYMICYEKDVQSRVHFLHREPSIHARLVEAFGRGVGMMLCPGSSRCWLWRQTGRAF